MRTFLINLDESKDRLEYMDGLLRGLGIAYERISGVLGRALTEEERKRSFRPIRSYIAHRGYRMTDAEIGCALSHLAVYRRMVEESIPLALVLEDDIRIEGGFRDALEEIGRTADPSRLQAILLSKPRGRHLMRGRGILAVKSASETCAYCITLEAAKLILRVNYPIVTTSDFYRRWRKLFGLELYRYVPSVVDQGAGFDSVIGGRKKGRSCFVKFVFGLLDRMICRFTGR